VNVLYEDSHGTLWMGTTGTLSRYDRADAQLQANSIFRQRHQQ